MQAGKILKYLCALVFTFAMFEGAVKAQGIRIDIGVQHLETDQVQIWVISDSTWTGYLSSIQWTLRWDVISTATLSDLVASSSVPFLDGLPQSGPTGDGNGYHHALFSAVPGQNATSFIADVPLLLGTFNVTNGPGSFEIADDAWTLANNGDFYISLNGNPSTGEIVDLTTAVQTIVSPSSSATLFPNPTTGNSLLSLELEQAGFLDIRVIDPSGRLVEQRKVAANAGAFRYTMASQALAEGHYTIQVEGAGLFDTVSWLVVR